jgi:SAM-dependent methyltransferase
MIEQRRPVDVDPVNLALIALVGAVVRPSGDDSGSGEPDRDDHPADQLPDRQPPDQPGADDHPAGRSGSQPHVVDVGGGSGTRAVPLAIAGCRVTVVDSSADALAILHRRAQDAGVQALVAGVQADAESLATVIPPGTADLVLCHQLLEEVDDPAGVVAALAAAVRPGGHVSVLTAGRLGAVLGQTLAGRFTQAVATLTSPDGRYSELDPLQRRYDAAGIGQLLADSGLFVESVTGVGVLSGLVSGAARQAVPGGDAELVRLEAAAAGHPALREIAADLHVVARRPVAGRPGVDDRTMDLADRDAATPR